MGGPILKLKKQGHVLFARMNEGDCGDPQDWQGKVAAPVRFRAAFKLLNGTRPRFHPRKPRFDLARQAWHTTYNAL